MDAFSLVVALVCEPTYKSKKGLQVQSRIYYQYLYQTKFFGIQASFQVSASPRDFTSASKIDSIYSNVFIQSLVVRFPEIMPLFLALPEFNPLPEELRMPLSEIFRFQQSLNFIDTKLLSWSIMTQALFLSSLYFFLKPFPRHESPT